ncbi:ATP-binding cassette domain-containing protein [Magnetococcales bacterium HHB-1]
MISNLKPPLLSLKGLCFNLPSGEKIFDQLNLKIDPGCCVSILGQECTGKTLLLHLIAELLPLKEGQILFQNSPIHTLSRASRAKKMSFIFRYPERYFLTQTVEQEIALMLNNNNIEHIEKALHFAGLNHHLKDRSLTTLSDSEKSRVAIAVAFATNPDLFLFDEPGETFSEQEEMILAERLQKHCRDNKMALLILTSREKRASLFGDKVYLLENKKLSLIS